MEKEEFGNSRGLGERERELFHALDVIPLPLLQPECKSRRDKKKATGWPPANCPSQTWHTLRECSRNIIRESTPEKLASLASVEEGRGEKKRRACVCMRAIETRQSIDIVFFPNLRSSSLFFFLLPVSFFPPFPRISITRRKNFFATRVVVAVVDPLEVSRFKNEPQANATPKTTGMKFYPFN